MNTLPASDGLYFISELPRSTPSELHQPIVKLEASSSPDLPPDTPAQLLRLQYLASHVDSRPLDSHSSSGDHSEPGTPIYPCALPSASLLRYAPPPQSYHYMSTHSWPSSSIGSPDSVSGPSDHTYRSKLDYAHMHHGTVAFDDYDDDVSELVDMSTDASRLDPMPSHLSNDKLVRRRSSKACDQCRKSKCKCERASPNEPCRSCITLGTQCTFLGPSRKRGPPKGYIDAIEARLHQTEALLGIIMSAGDDRAHTLLHDIAKDPLAKEIIKRVDNSSYGPQGRQRGDNVAGSKRPASSSEPVPPHSSGKFSLDKFDIQSTHPSNDWQDHVLSILRSASITRGTLVQGGSDVHISPTDSRSRDVSNSVPGGAGGRPILRVYPPEPHDLAHAHTDDDNLSAGRRQRRRVGTDDPGTYGYMATSPRDSASPVFLSRVAHGSVGLGRGSSPNSSNHHTTGRLSGNRHSSSSMESTSSGSEDELPEAVGQLSLNEDAEVRYHGKASGLYLLGSTERNDGRNEGGIWRFPKARVWPPLPDAQSGSSIQTSEVGTPNLPEPALQEHLLELYFTYVHPSFPIIHKKTFLEDYKMGSVGPEESRSPAPDSHTGSHSSPTPPYSRRRRRIPVLLLLTIFSVAARFETTTNTSPPYPSDGSTMWAAGDQYLDEAKVLIDRSYSSSRPSTCQALLLMGYREVGIGAMAQAWTYIGMAVRMAQDLGIHRSADDWARAELGGRLFNDSELHERKRIWYGCVIMDKYVSAYIGRPLAIYESDFDTPLPEEDELDEHELWRPHPSQPVHGPPLPPVPGRILSCFNRSASLSNILGQIMEGLYAIRPRNSRHEAAARLERILDKWHIDLPEHLHYEPGSHKYTVPPPHVLNLHLQYWCTVVLLHRPFIRRMPKNKLPVSMADSDAKALAERSYNVCIAAANHITTIVNEYIENWCIKRGAVFLCYYVFTASLMHTAALSFYPNDLQAQVGLMKCMDALRRLEVVWPSAARALELLRGSKLNLDQDAVARVVSPSATRRKRSADTCLDDLSNRSRSETQEMLNLRPHNAYGPVNTTGSGGVYSHSENDGSSIRTPYFHSYERWTSDTSNTEIPFSGPLSTSVLPQMYSTGLAADERAVTAGSRSHPNPEHGQGHGQQQSQQQQRVPPYWNDYSAFTTYGNLPQGPATQGGSSMYMPEQYGIYGTNHPPRM